MSKNGKELQANNEEIIKYLRQLKDQRNELNLLIERQELEQNHIRTEIERFYYKLALISKSLAHRIKARDQYDKTIKEIEEKYNTIVITSEDLLNTVKEEVTLLEKNTLDKKIGTEDDTAGDYKNSPMLSEMSSGESERTGSEVASLIEELKGIGGCCNDDKNSCLTAEKLSHNPNRLNAGVTHDVSDTFGTDTTQENSNNPGNPMESIQSEQTDEELALEYWQRKQKIQHSVDAFKIGYQSMHEENAEQANARDTIVKKMNRSLILDKSSTDTNSLSKGSKQYSYK